jgi:EgtB-related family protein
MAARATTPRAKVELDATVGPGTPLREAGRDVLSLALIDARNHTLRLFALLEAALGERGLAVPLLPELNPPLWALGHVGWFQEYWIARNLQRQRGAGCDPGAPRLASIEPQADVWYDASAVAHDARRHLALPPADAVRAYLLDTLDTSLDLLAGTHDDADDALYFYRLTLFHEDMHGEALVRMAQTLDVGGAGIAALLPLPEPKALRDPLVFPATRWPLGATPGRRGFVFDNEQWAHDVQVPEFEIDAQPVSWAQYAEFVEDGGYGQPAMHVGWHEADAWCRWAGRRLPTEVEWEYAAATGVSRGLRWGEVWEWTAGTFRPYPGFAPGPWRDYSQPSFGTHKAMRGASFATRARMRDVRFRGFGRPERDDAFVGFRSCAP